MGLSSHDLPFGSQVELYRLNASAPPSVPQELFAVSEPTPGPRGPPGRTSALALGNTAATPPIPAGRQRAKCQAGGVPGGGRETVTVPSVRYSYGARDGPAEGRVGRGWRRVRDGGGCCWRW
ncbi:hypothetical protein SFR_1998 [Streptomyces sp. FR-008]|nr:hypothetical protein SFR_1998 [Streptomyces sp. FR-008]